MFQLLRYEGFFSQILGKLIYQFLGKLNCQNLRKQSYELHDDGNRSKAINIVTTIEDKNTSIGEFIVGYGSNNRYNTKGNVNFFRGNNIYTIGFGSNNINQSALFGGRNYGRYGVGGIQNATAVKLNYAGEFGIKDSEKYTTIGATYTFDRTNVNNSSSMTQVGIVTNDNYKSQTTSDRLSNIHNFNGDLESTLNNSTIIFRPSVSISNNSSISSDFTERLIDNAVTNRSTTDDSNNGASYNVGGKLMFMQKIKDRHLVTTGVDARISKSNTNQFLKGTISSMDAMQSELADSIINQNGKLLSIGNTLNGVVGYTYKINPNQGINVDYEVGYDWGNSDKKTYLFDPATGEYRDILNGLSNEFKRDYLSQTVNLGYSLNDPKRFIVNAKIGYQSNALQSRTIYPQRNPLNHQFSNLISSLLFEYIITDSKRIIVKYNGNPLLPTINQLQDVLDNSNPLKVSMGNPNLSQGYRNYFSFRYTTANKEKSTAFRVTASGSYEKNGFANNVVSVARDTIIGGVNIVKGAQLSSPVNVSGYMRGRLGFTYTFPVSLISSKMNTALYLRYDREPTMFENQRYFSTSKGFATNVSINSNISKDIDFTVGANATLSNVTSTRSGIADNLYINPSAEVKLNWMFMKNFVFNAEYSYNYNYYSVNPPSKPDYHLLNFGLGYKFLKQNAEFRVSVFDALNQSSAISRNVTDLYITNAVSTALQRYVMLSFSYKFNRGMRNE